MGVLDGIERMRHAFIGANMKPPSVILLESHEEGMRFLSEVRQTMHWAAIARDLDLGSPVEMAVGSGWMEVKVMGCAVRWPVKKLATPNGSWNFV